MIPLIIKKFTISLLCFLALGRAYQCLPEIKPEPAWNSPKSLLTAYIEAFLNLNVRKYQLDILSYTTDKAKKEAENLIDLVNSKDQSKQSEKDTLIKHIGNLKIHIDETFQTTGDLFRCIFFDKISKSQYPRYFSFIKKHERWYLSKVSESM